MFEIRKKKREEKSVLLSEKLEVMQSNLQVHLLKVQKNRNEVFDKLVEARRKGLAAQETTARNLMKKSMAAEKQISGMIVSLGLAVQARDLATLTRNFVECIGVISKDLIGAVSKTNAKKAERDYLKILYASQKQEENLDNMLMAGDYSLNNLEYGSKYEEFDAEIDALLAHVETNNALTQEKTQY